MAIRPVPNVIERENDSRRIDVAANVEGRDLGSVVADVKTALAGVTFERGYHAELLGEYAEREAASSNLGRIAIIAGLAILLLLQVAFGTLDFARTTDSLTKLMGKGEAQARRELMELHGDAVEVDV